MSLKKEPCRGTRDFFPPLRREQDYLFGKMRRAAELFGYEPYDGPMIEDLQLYLEKSGEELVSEQIYAFEDRGGRKVAIRPEMTPTLARMVSRIYREAPKPLRWYSIPNLMRYERPQKGRLREHWQFNADIFGAPEGYGEFEILHLAQTFLESFGATREHFKILVNDRRVVDHVFSKMMSCDSSVRGKLYGIVDKAKKVKESTLGEMLDACGLSSRDRKVLDTYLKLSSFEELFAFLEGACRGPLESLVKKAQAVSLEQYLCYDPVVVRGFDYYTGIVFEVFDESVKNPRAICGGGAYDNLLSLFNEGPLGGVGFGLGDVTLRDFLKGHGLLPNFDKSDIDLYIVCQRAEDESTMAALAKDLRLSGVKLINHPGALKFQKARTLAEKNGSRSLLYFGEREAKEGVVQVRSLGNREQQSFAVSAGKEIAHYLLKDEL